MRSFFTNYEAGGKQAQAQGVSGQDQPTAALVSPAVIQFISAQSSQWHLMIYWSATTWQTISVKRRKLMEINKVDH